jgi:ABC-type multidrug transport system fused ATPase/permease subunit
MILKNIRNSFKNILYVSKISSIKSKKIKITFSLLLSNLSVLLDIVIILYFSYLLSTNTTSGLNIFYRYILDFLFENNYLMIFVVVFRFIFFYLEKVILQKLTLEIRESLRNYLLKEIYDRGNYSIADSTFYVNELTIHVSYFYNSFAKVLNHTIQVLIYTFFLIYSNLEFSIYLLIMGIIIYFPTRFLLNQARKYIHISYEKSKKINQDIQKVIDNMFLIKILKTSEQELLDFKNVSTSYADANFKNFNFSTINSLFPTFFVTIVFVIALLSKSILRLITLEFIGVTLRLVQTLGNLNTSLNALINSQVHIEKLIEFENDKETKLIPTNLDSEMKNNLAVEIEDVDFKYFGSNEYMFENLNLNFQKNKHTVITGLNGTGKSTLIGLISGIYFATKGRVTLFSNKLGYVGPVPLIINSTIRENLKYGNFSDVSDNKLIEFITLFDLFNGEIPDLDMIISNKSLSSGQMQKISFIRAMLADIDILFLDESTANLDTETKNKIYSVLNKLNLTVINSTHSKEDFEYDTHIEIKNIEGKRLFTLK